MRNLGAPELILILVVILLLFGWKRLPDMSRSMGRSLRIFKSEIKELKDDEGSAAAPQPADPVKPSGQPPTP